MRQLQLKNGKMIPQLGFGTWQLQGDEAYESVRHALKVGYRHIDTAERYDNETQVGNAIHDSGLDRSEIFLTSKVWTENLSYQEVIDHCQDSLDRLQTEYLDLYLIHWPNKNFLITETLSAMLALLERKKIMAIGVSNFTINHLKDAIATGVEITNNQVEFHPSLYQQDLKQFCDENKIILTAYSPIAQGQDLKLPLIQELSQKYGRSPAQVVLNWIMSHGIVAIPRSSTPQNIEDNFKTLEWELNPEDAQKIDQLNTHNRLLNPDFAEFDY